MNSSISDSVLLRLEGICKDFGSVKAIRDMELSVRAGRVHTLLGENGAGKSTLMKILAGVYRPTAGRMIFKGEKYEPKDPKDAARAGMAIVFQELSLCNNLTVAENILATREPARFGLISDHQLVTRAESLVRALDLPIDVRARVADLSIAQRQLIEIAKGLSHDADLVILDEPTSSLSESEVEILFAIIDRLRAAGKAIIYISHRMEEIMRLSDDITVLRDGEYVTTRDKTETTIEELIALMVGRRMDEIYPARDTPLLPSSGTAALEVRGLGRPGSYSNISFIVQPGEILGFFGLIGSGRSEVMASIFGLDAAVGEILINGEPVTISGPDVAIAKGIGFVTENRKEQGLVLSQSLRANVSMASLGRFTRRGWVDIAAEKREALAEKARLNIRAHSIETATGTLSGGNQQKVVLAKWLATRAKVMILDEPTRGVDVGAKFEIYRIIRQLAAEGTAIIMISSELPEVLGLADRVAVMAEGRLQTIAPRAELTPERVMAFATEQH